MMIGIKTPGINRLQTIIAGDLRHGMLSVVWRQTVKKMSKKAKRC